jgi:hypothetical protein
MREQPPQWYLVGGGETFGWKLRDCRATQLEQAEQEAEEALKDIRAQGDLAALVAGSRAARFRLPEFPPTKGATAGGRSARAAEPRSARGIDAAFSSSGGW